MDSNRMDMDFPSEQNWQPSETELNLREKLLMPAKPNIVDEDFTGSFLEDDDISSIETKLLIVELLDSINEPMNRETGEPGEFDLTPAINFFIRRAKDKALLLKGYKGRTAEMLITQRHISEGKQTHYTRYLEEQPTKKKFLGFI